MSIEWNPFLAYEFLKQSWDASTQKFHCDLSNGLLTVHKRDEIFTTMVILELLGALSLEEAIKKGALAFIENQMKPDNVFFFEPCAPAPDIDHTALGVSLLTELHHISESRAIHSVHRILSNVCREGLRLSDSDRTDSSITSGISTTQVLEVFLTGYGYPKRCVDAVACANALYVINLYGKREEAKATEDFVAQLLTEEDPVILKWCPYYHSPDTLLYQVSRLISRFPKLRSRFTPLLQKKLQKRIGTTERCLDLAMRVIASKAVDISFCLEAKKLACLQLPSGSWPKAAFFTNGKSGADRFYYGSESISTAFSIRALSS